MILFGVILLGIVLRLLLASYGHNYDYDSYKIVASILRHGGNVYVETPRYNYGPIWFGIIFIIDNVSRLFSNPELVFRLGILSVLTTADGLITFILYKQFGLKAAVIFFLNPVSIVVTGFFSQFDNVAIAVALSAVFLMKDDFKEVMTRRKLLALFLLGVSITVKHLFLFFPIWIAVKQKGFKNKSLSIIIPVGLFLLSFAPFWQAGSLQIIDNVFRYDSFHNAPLMSFFFAGVYRSFDLARLLWFIAMIIGALIFRKKQMKENVLMYLFMLVIFSPSIIYHYLAIVMAGVAVYFNEVLLIYTVLSAYLLCLDSIGLNVRFLIDHAPWFFLYEINTIYVFHIPIAILALGFVWIFYGKRITGYTRSSYEWLKNEIKIQIKSF